MRIHIGWVVAAGLVSPAACSGPGSVSNSAVGADQACADWAMHYCTRIEFCEPFRLQTVYGDVTRCAARSKPLCLSRLKANGTGAAPGSVATCAQAYDSLTCGDVFIGKPPEACNVPGSLSAGAPCGDNSQCGGKNGYCNVASGQTCGACATLGPAGANCDSDRDCQYGLVCLLTCMVPVAQGAACDISTHVCPETLACVNSVCSPPTPLGSACSPNADNCDGARGQFCDRPTGVCSQFSIAGIGAPCGNGAACGGGGS
jgi:hypothetical protein